MPRYGAHARYVLDDVVKEGEAGLETRRRRGRPPHQIGRHDFLLRLHELLHHAEVLLHHHGSRVGRGLCLRSSDFCLLTSAFSLWQLEIRWQPRGLQPGGQRQRTPGFDLLGDRTRRAPRVKVLQLGIETRCV